MLLKTCVCRPEIGPKHFDKFKPEPGPKPGSNPARPEKPGPTYNSASLCLVLPQKQRTQMPETFRALFMNTVAR